MPSFDSNDSLESTSPENDSIPSKNNLSPDTIENSQEQLDISEESEEISNPFLENIAGSESEFFNSLEEIFSDRSGTEKTKAEKIPDETDEWLPTDRWEEVFGENINQDRENLLRAGENPNDGSDAKLLKSDEWQELKKPLGPGPLVRSIYSSSQQKELASAIPDLENFVEENANIAGSSVSNLRQTYIQETEQTAIAEPIEEPAKNKKNFSKTLKLQFNALGKWVSQLGGLEKTLMGISAALLILAIFSISSIVKQLQDYDLTAITAPTFKTSAGETAIYPTGLQLPGGWFFYLQPGKIVDGSWNPEKSEWLWGTELRRVVAIPYSKEAEAVFLTLSKGDKFTLILSDQDTQTYRVETVQKVTSPEVELLLDQNPALIVILENSESVDRWVAICKQQ